MLTQQLLKDMFRYEDGQLIRLTAPSNRVQIGDKAGASDSAGYVRVRINNKDYLLHRLIWLYHYGELPKYIDHIDQEPSNNRLENLRPLTHSENIANCDKVNTNSGVRGVSICKKTGKFYAQIMKNYKNYNLGYFNTAEEASDAYNRGRKDLFPGVHI